MEGFAGRAGTWATQWRTRLGGRRTVHAAEMQPAAEPPVWHDDGERERREAAERRVAQLEQELQQARDALAGQVQQARELAEALRGAQDAARHSTAQAGRIVAETSRLRGLATTFERWHEQMIALMAQNREMHTKNAELASIVRHVVIVSLNASIEAAHAGQFGRGFAIVAGEVRSLAARSEALARGFGECLHKNDLSTAATFQDIQAGGKMITASLSQVESLAGQLVSVSGRAGS
jgi:methyl-accepting chemotaxis protein